MAILESIKPIPFLTDRAIKNFWDKVQKSDDPEACWEWTGALNDRGYGIFTTSPPNKRTLKAHRVGYYLGTGVDPINDCCLHICDNTRCVRFSHMRLGDQKDNLDDMYRKGRGPVGDKSGLRKHPERAQRGEKRWNSKLTENSVVEIRKMRAAGIKAKDIAAKFNVTLGCVYGVAYRISWKHVP